MDKDKPNSSRQVPKWETLNKDILAFIFGKLDMKDLTMGASRVCISWFLASHNNTLWNTVDLAKFQQVDEGLSLINFLRKNIKHFDIYETRRSLRSITKLSRSVPKNLFFSFDSYIGEEDLMFAAERMPNIEKLVLPRWCFQSKKSFQFAFSRWKNLKTLIIAHHHVTGKFEFQAVGENCKNLSNLKYLGCFENYTAKQIVRYLKNIKRLSLQCSFYSKSGVLLLIKDLQNLLILNISHCKDLHTISYDHPEIVQAATQKRVRLIDCSKDNCMVCKNQPMFSSFFWMYDSKQWANDGIKELEF